MRLFFMWEEARAGGNKSKLSFARIDYLCDAGKGVLFIESDTANSDTYKAHLPHASDSLVCREANLDTSDGWIELVNAADEFPHHCMVFNSAARSGPGIEKCGMPLRETPGELDRELVMFWVINRQRDSVELLRGF